MPDEFDYVIVGGGTAGCVLANRLSANPAVSVLLLEAGGEGDGFWTKIPAGFGKLLTNQTYNWRFWTHPEANTHHREIVVPRGKGLGGSSLINGMIFVRGQPGDYDQWAQLGNRGWGFPDVLPYFRKLENFESSGDETRGDAGPVDIIRVKERPILAEAFLKASEEAGFARNADYNGAEQDGFGYYQVNQRNGRRWSARDAYLQPVRDRKNLEIRTGAHVTRVVLTGGRASGVVYQQGAEQILVHAKGEVILAAGAVQSPQILELSGIGDPSVLSGAGVRLEHPLPGVGANYADHYATRMNWRVSKPITLNEKTRGANLALAVAQYFLTRTGILTLGTGLAHGFVRTREGLAGPDVQYFFMDASYANAGDRKLDKQPGMTIGVSQLRPESRGHIHITSSDPLQAPRIQPNFLATAEDQRTLVEGMKVARRIMTQLAIAPYLLFEMSPGDRIKGDAEWLDFACRQGQTIYHACGTCRMGQGDDAVVDDRLRVRGIDGLRVVDASIMPTIVSGNTAAAVFMIAEKGADLIRSDYLGR